MEPSAEALELSCQGLQQSLADSVHPHLERAIRNLDLASDFKKISVVIDDLPTLAGEQDGWLRLERFPCGASSGLAATLFCNESSFCTPVPELGHPWPGTEIWDQAVAPLDGLPFDRSRFSKDRADVFLHHELLLAQDLARGVLLPTAIPSDSVEAFSAAWAVVLDGRLDRLGLPGYGLVARRARFSRLFACAGVLLPGHWQIFQSLWDGGISRWQDVLGSIGDLPPL